VSVQSGVYKHTVTDERRAHLSVEKCPKAHNMCRQGARTCTGLVNRHSVPWQWRVNLPMHNRRRSHICSMATTQWGCTSVHKIQTLPCCNESYSDS
jgi:hypothetical protein